VRVIRLLHRQRGWHTCAVRPRHMRR
jgi:hypothetical protein